VGVCGGVCGACGECVGVSSAARLCVALVVTTDVRTHSPHALASCLPRTYTRMQCTQTSHSHSALRLTPTLWLPGSRTGLVSSPPDRAPHEPRSFTSPLLAFAPETSTLSSGLQTSTHSRPHALAHVSALTPTVWLSINRALTPLSWHSHRSGSDHPLSPELRHPHITRTACTSCGFLPQVW
jgi:hypothetical protein